MRIAVIIQQAGFLRFIEPQLERLCMKGHQIHIGCHDYPIRDEDGLLESLCRRFPNISVGWAWPRGDRWASLAGTIRGMLDYHHYLYPDFRDYSEARDRAKKHAGIAGRAVFKLLHALKFNQNYFAANCVMGILRSIEQALPPDPLVLSYLRQLDVDLVLLTSLVWPRSAQADYVKACHRLGIKTVLILNSWDDLASKGDIKEQPDWILVWNEYQAQEAVRFHGMSKSNVIVTGAPSLDHWFMSQPSQSREDFCQQVGLPNTKPYLLYVCPSPTITPGQSERGHFQEWLSTLRASSLPELKDINVIVWTYRHNAAIWEDFYVHDPGVVILPQKGKGIFLEEEHSTYFHSLYYCTAVVGNSTDSMIEAAIVGAKGFALQTDSSATMQVEKMHFRHLTELGIVESHKDFEEHVNAIARIVQGSAQERSPIPGVMGLVRPYGKDCSATDIAVSAIEKVLKGNKKKQKVFSPALLWLPILTVGALVANFFQKTKAQKDQDPQQLVRHFATFLESIQGQPQFHYYAKQIGAILERFGYTVLGPYDLNETRGNLGGSFKTFCQSFLNEPSDVERRKIIKPLIHLLRRSGMEMVDKGRIAKNQVRGESRDALFEKLYEITANEGRSLLGRVRLYVIWQALQNVADLPYPTIEVGVYRGGTSAFVVRALQMLSAFPSIHYAIDPFCGHQDRDVQEFEHHKPGYFSDVIESYVRAYLEPLGSITVLTGTFEDVAPRLPEHLYRFVHIDTDLYRPTLQALEYFTTRMAPGGVIIVDDYMAQKCVGVTRAVHEFLEGSSSFYAWAFDTEQMVLIKAPVNAIANQAPLAEMGQSLRGQ